MWWKKSQKAKREREEARTKRIPCYLCQRLGVSSVFPMADRQGFVRLRCVCKDCAKLAESPASVPMAVYYMTNPMWYDDERFEKWPSGEES